MQKRCRIPWYDSPLCILLACIKSTTEHCCTWYLYWYFKAKEEGKQQITAEDSTAVRVAKGATPVWAAIRVKRVSEKHVSAFETFLRFWNLSMLLKPFSVCFWNLSLFLKPFTVYETFMEIWNLYESLKLLWRFETFVDIGRRNKKTFETFTDVWNHCI